MTGSRDDDPESVCARTLAYYDRVAAEFRDGTWGHDVRQNVEALLRHVEGEPPFTILDLGCGPGRDLVTFTELGHVAIGVEGSGALARMAREASGCEVLEQRFLALDLPRGSFHGVFANASLFHVPRRELLRVLTEVRDALRPRGVLFSSNPRGGNEEGWSGERYGCYHDLESWRGFVTAAGFEELEHYYRPAGRPRSEQPWLATVWRRRS